MGADKLLGNGDLLFLWPGTSTLLRGQGTYLSDDEMTRVIDAVSTTEPQYVKELVQLKAAEHEPEGRPASNRDELYDAAVEMVIREGRGSCSLLQRALGIGYGRAARLIDYMAEDGIVGAYNGSQAREVLVTLEQWGAMRGRQPSAAGPAPAPRRPSNRILLTPAAPHEADPRDEEDEELDDDAAAGVDRAPDGLDLGETADRMPPWEDEEDASAFDRHEQEGDPSDPAETGPADPSLRAWKAESA
jgi:S-DNA-T family DNA segregation ATPase FtsK/SpoIIIE